MHGALHHAAAPRVGTRVGEDPEAEGDEGEEEDGQEDEGDHLPQGVAPSQSYMNSATNEFAQWKRNFESHLLPGGSSVQMSSRQTSGSAHSTEALQKTHGLYVVQLSPRHTAQRVQFPTDGSATASEMREGPSVSLLISRKEEVEGEEEEGEWRRRRSPSGSPTIL